MALAVDVRGRVPLEVALWGYVRVPAGVRVIVGVTLGLALAVIVRCSN
ncbi:MAG: hypothetical protein AB7N53_09285 [Candidatus Binatia bacterium]